jgi:hypothetical protein
MECKLRAACQFVSESTSVFFGGALIRELGRRKIGRVDPAFPQRWGKEATHDAAPCVWSRQGLILKGFLKQPTHRNFGSNPKQPKSYCFFWETPRTYLEGILEATHTQLFWKQSRAAQESLFFFGSRQRAIVRGFHSPQIEFWACFWDNKKRARAAVLEATASRLSVIVFFFWEPPRSYCVWIPFPRK